MAQIESGHDDDRVGAVPGPDSVNRRVTGPGTEPGSVPGLVRLRWAMCKRGLGHHDSAFRSYQHYQHVRYRACLCGVMDRVVDK